MRGEQKQAVRSETLGGINWSVVVRTTRITPHKTQKVIPEEELVVKGANLKLPELVLIVVEVFPPGDATPKTRLFTVEPRQQEEN